MISQIKGKITKPQTADFLNLCESSFNLLVTPFYDVIRIIIVSYIMYSISQYLFLLVLGLTPFKILGILGGQFFKKEESIQLPWKLEFCKGLLDKILQVIVIYNTGVRFIENEISIEDLVIFGSQVVTFDRLLPAVKTDFEGLGKALVLFEKVFEEMEVGNQSEQEQIGEEVFEEKPRNTEIQWKFWSFYENFLNKNMRRMKRLFYQTIRKIKTLRIWKKECEQVGRQEQGLSLNTEKKKRLSVVKSVKEKVESWVGKRKELMNEEGSPRKRERVMMNT